MAPITLTAANIFTAANGNSYRDNLTFLKGAFDTMTASSTADTGTGMFLAITRPTANDYVLRGLVTGDAQFRWYVLADGGMSWGSGAAAQDVSLSRSAANVLSTPDQFIATDGITTKIVAGVVGDGSFTATPGNGTIAIDTTNFQIYVRCAGVWKKTVAMT